LANKCKSIEAELKANRRI